LTEIRNKNLNNSPTPLSYPTKSHFCSSPFLNKRGALYKEGRYENTKSEYLFQTHNDTERKSQTIDFELIIFCLEAESSFLFLVDDKWNIHSKKGCQLN